MITIPVKPLDEVDRDTAHLCGKPGESAEQFISGRRSSTMRMDTPSSAAPGMIHEAAERLILGAPIDVTLKCRQWRLATIDGIRAR
eukprot:7696510-Lingulodinium_polyedra.AAC.1